MADSEPLNLGERFRSYFRIDAAVSPALLNDVFRIRHEVYCEDLHFEPERPDRREMDEFDAHSLQCLLRTADESRRLVGCTRLVLANPDDPDALLPFERTCARTLDRSIIDPASLPRKRIAEVSRLAVRAAYRRRKGEERSPHALSETDFGTNDQPRFPYIPISLYLGALALAVRHDIDMLFFVTEPRLAAHFSRLGVNVLRIGDCVEHRGQRVPSMFDVHQVVESMRPSLRSLWEVVMQEINEGLTQANTQNES